MKNYVIIGCAVLSGFLQSCMGTRREKPSDGTAVYTKECLNSFYKGLAYDMNIDSFVVLPELRDGIIKNKELLTHGYGYSDIVTFIQEADYFTDGEYMDTIVDLRFPDGGELFYQVTDGLLNHIWLSDGRNLVDTTWYFRRPACIRDSLVSVSVREDPKAQSNVMATFHADELFYYTPNSDTEWVRVYRDENTPPIGFVHKSQIKNYDDFSDDMKKELFDLRSGA